MNEPRLESIVDALKASKLSSGSYSAKCPSHDDKSPSLSISKPNGKILFRCHAGCSQAEVIEALQDRGLWPKAERRIFETYDYIDADGVLQSQAVRYMPKAFSQRRPDGMGGWVWNLRGVKVVPYNLPNVIKAIAAGEHIAIVEGEKDVESLRKIGITATCNAGGAGKWKRYHAEHLQGARAIIMPDNDEPGRAHAKQVAASLRGIAASIKVVELPDLPDKGDVSDWLANGGTREKLEALFSRAHEAVANATEKRDPLEASAPEPVANATTPRFPHVWLDDAAVELTNDDLVKHLIGRRAFVLIYGPSGDGKTFFGLDLFGHIAAGIDWCGRRVRACLVVYIAAEAGVSIVRRFYAWRDRRISEVRTERIPLAILTRGANLLDAMEVEALIEELKRIAAEAGVPLGAVVIDTFSRSLAGGNENAPEDVTRAIATADRIRDELGAATAFVHHTGKDIAKGARGHNSLYAAADTVISVIDRVATVEKSRDGMAGQQFAFDLDIVNLGEDDDGDPLSTCVVRHLAGAAPRRKAEPTGKNQRVVWSVLRDLLLDSGQSLPETSAIPRGVRGVRYELLEQRACAKFPGKEPRRQRQAISEALVGLQAVNLIGVHEQWIWAQ